MSITAAANIRKYVPLGRVVMSACARRALTDKDIYAALARHKTGDWGDVSEADRRANNNALNRGGRLLSVYTGADGDTFWVITEADKSSTTVPLPGDY